MAEGLMCFLMGFSCLTTCCGISRLCFEKRKSSFTSRLTDTPYNIIGSECAICTFPLEAETQVRQTSCQHYYHDACYQHWKKTREDRGEEMNCPICLRSISD